MPETEKAIKQLLSTCINMGRGQTGLIDRSYQRQKMPCERNHREDIIVIAGRLSRKPSYVVLPDALVDSSPQEVVKILLAPREARRNTWEA